MSGRPTPAKRLLAMLDDPGTLLGHGGEGGRRDRVHVTDQDVDRAPGGEDHVGAAVGRDDQVSFRKIRDTRFSFVLDGNPEFRGTILQDAQQRGLLIASGAIAQRLQIEGRRVRAVEYADADSGQTQRAAGDLVIVAAGAIQSPALLMRSGLEHPLIGRNLMRHCNAVCSYVFPFRTNPQQVFHKQLCFGDFYEDLRSELGTAVGVIQDIYTPSPEVIRHHAPPGSRWIAEIGRAHV